MFINIKVIAIKTRQKYGVRDISILEGFRIFWNIQNKYFFYVKSRFAYEKKKKHNFVPWTDAILLFFTFSSFSMFCPRLFVNKNFLGFLS